jgi:NAD dependent epimerase/dehydratase family enzyme
MAFKGKEISKNKLTAISKLLWHGDVDGAIAFMANVDPSEVKNQSFLRQLTDYLNRVRDFIPNYAIRHELGLRHGSGIVKTTNNLLVAKRQKRSGMSWSHNGSVCLATLTCAIKNGDLKNWTQMDFLSKMGTVFEN